MLASSHILHTCFASLIIYTACLARLIMCAICLTRLFIYTTYQWFPKCVLWTPGEQRTVPRVYVDTVL